MALNSISYLNHETWVVIVGQCCHAIISKYCALIYDYKASSTIVAQNISHVANSSIVGKFIACHKSIAKWASTIVTMIICGTPLRTINK